MSQEDEKDRKLFENSDDEEDNDEQRSEEELDEDDEDQDEDDDDREPYKRKGAKLKDKKPRKKQKRSRRQAMEDFFDQEAFESSNDEEYEEQPDDAEIKDDEARERMKDVYSRPRADQTELFRDLEGKNEEEIERLFRERSYSQYSAENSCPGPEDPCVFLVPCKRGREDAICLALLNKASKLKGDKDKKVNIISACSLRRRFGTYIFLEVWREKDTHKSIGVIRKALEGMPDVYLGRVQQMRNEDYETLFREKQKVVSTIRKDDYIRIVGGLYDGDLGKVYDVRKRHFDVALVPRINVQDLGTKFRDLKEKYQNSPDSEKIFSRNFKKYFDYREPHDRNRPPKKFTFANELPDIKQITRLKLTKEGFILLSFTAEELSQKLGVVQPKEMSFFNKGEDNSSDFMHKQLPHLHSTINIVRGDEVQIAYGDTKGIVGIVKEVRDNIAVIETKKNLGIDYLEQPIEKLVKRFKPSQRVKIASGNDKGKTGLILKIEDRQAYILTENENQIKVLVNNLIAWNGPETSNDEAREDFKKFELIKTTNGIGIVLASMRDSLKILDANNSVKVISVLDFDSRIDTRRNFAKNSYDEVVKNGAIVRVIQGVHAGKRCEVKHVYKDLLFLYNADIYQSNSITVDRVTNCILVTPSSQFKHSRPVYGMNSQYQDPKKQNFRNEPGNQELQVGKTITIKAGQFKGYQGTIVNNSGANIGVRLTAKGKVVNVSRDHILAVKKTMEIGKTPRVSASSYAAQSPAAWSESRHERNVDDY